MRALAQGQNTSRKAKDAERGASQPPWAAAPRGQVGCIESPEIRCWQSSGGRRGGANGGMRHL